MRIRTVLGGAALLLVALAIPGRAGPVEDYRAYATSRGADPELNARQRKALGAADRLLERGGLLRDRVRAAKGAVAKITPAFRRDEGFAAAGGTLATGLASAVSTDADDVTALLTPPAKRRIAPADRVTRARTLVERALGARTPLAALGLLDRAAGDLRAAFPPQPDFTSPDANTESATYGAEVTPRDFAGSATGWYFIRAT